MESSNLWPKKAEKYLIYFTNQYITDVVADDWRVREGKFLFFFLNGREVFVANFNNIYGFCSMEKEDLIDGTT